MQEVGLILKVFLTPMSGGGAGSWLGPQLAGTIGQGTWTYDPSMLPRLRHNMAVRFQEQASQREKAKWKPYHLL